MSRFLLPLESTFNINGLPQDGAKLEFFEVGTTTLKDTYSDESLSIPNANPVIASGYGRFGSIWLNGDYDVTLKSKDDVLVWGAETIRSLQSSIAPNTTKNYETMPALVAKITSDNIKIDDLIYLEERLTGSGGGGWWKAIDATTSPGNAPNEYNIVTGDANINFKLIVQSVHNVKQYGAVGDGVTSDNLVIRHVLEEASTSKSSIYFPEGIYLVTQLDMRSDTVMYGDGVGSVLLRDSAGTINQVLMRIFNTDTVAPYSPSLNAANITIKNMKFLGTVATEAFSEFKHLIMCQGVTNLNIHNNYFEGWQGDAIVIRSGNSTAAAQNYNMDIYNNVFDGVNNDNRNAISITDASVLWIHNNKFKNGTRSNMPGAIDIEPNTADTFVKLNNIHIYENDFENIGGNVAAISMFLPMVSSAFTNGEPKDITVRDNVIDGCFIGYYFKQVQSSKVDDTFEDMNIKFLRNTVKNATERPWWIYGLKGVTSKDNTFDSSPESSRIGFNSNEFQGCHDVSVSRDKYIKCGNNSGTALLLYDTDRLDIDRVKYHNCGVSGGGFGIAIDFIFGSFSEVVINNNEIINNLGLTTAAITFSSTTAGVFVVGASYKISSIGSTDFTLIGAASNTVGVTFVATGAGTGTGTATAYLITGDNKKTSNIFANLDSSAFGADYTEFGENTSETGITAITGSQAAAVQLTKSMNSIDTVTVAFDGAKLPTASGDGRQIIVRNAGANTISLYPFLGDNLGNGTNAPESVVSGDTRFFKTYDVNNWLMVPGL